MPILTNLYGGHFPEDSDLKNEFHFGGAYINLLKNAVFWDVASRRSHVN
jgi:hypothetical protein